MALPVIPNVYRCAVRQSVAGQTAVNVFHVVDLTTPTATQVAEGVALAWGKTGSICSLQTTAVDLEGVDVGAGGGEQLGLALLAGGEAPEVEGGVFAAPQCIIGRDAEQDGGGCEPDQGLRCYRHRSAPG